MALPGVTTASTMMTMARQEADMVNSTFVTDAELLGYLNASYFTLYNLIVEKYGENYFMVNNYQFTTDGTSEFFSLPDGSATYVLPSSGGIAPAFFKLMGVDLWISSTVTSPAQWFTLHRFNFGERNMYTNPISIATRGYMGIRYRLNANQLWLRPLPQSGQLINVRYVPRLTPLVQSAGTIALSTVIAGNTVTINGTVMTGISGSTAGTSFHIGVSDTLTAVELAACINTNITTVTATASSTTVTVTPSSGTVVWSASSTMTLTPTSATPWAFTADLISGWEEIAVVDAAIKMLDKEESDTSVKMARKAELIAQMTSAADNRDPGEPQTVVDTERANSFGPLGFSGGWGL